MIGHHIEHVNSAPAPKYIRKTDLEPVKKSDFAQLGDGRGCSVASWVSEVRIRREAAADGSDGIPEGP